MENGIAHNIKADFLGKQRLQTEQTTNPPCLGNLASRADWIEGHRFDEVEQVTQMPVEGKHRGRSPVAGEYLQQEQHLHAKVTFAGQASGQDKRIKHTGKRAENPPARRGARSAQKHPVSMGSAPLAAHRPPPVRALGGGEPQFQLVSNQWRLPRLA